MSNGDDQQQANCILGVCCDAQKRRYALAEKIEHDLHLSEHDAKRVADWINDHYDLAPKDSLVAFKDAIAALARGNPYE